MQNNLRNGWVAFQHRVEGRLDEDAEAEVGAPGVQGGKRRREHNHIAKRTHANDEDFRAARKIGEDAGGASWIQCELRPPT